MTFSPLSASLSTRLICSLVNLLPFILQSSVPFIPPENTHFYWYSFRGKGQNSKPNHRTRILILSSMVGPAGFARLNKWPDQPPIVRNGSLGVAFDEVVLEVEIEEFG